jgi:esterase/lipase
LALAAPLRPGLARATLAWQWELLRGIRETRALLPELRCPVLTLASRDDDSVSWKGARELHERCASPRKELVLLEGQGHVLSAAPARESEVYPPVLRFLEITDPEAGNRSPHPRNGDA